MEQHGMAWIAEANGWVAHPVTIVLENGQMLSTPWYGTQLTRGLTGWWYRVTHRCTPHSIGVHGWFAEMAVTERCICGGIRTGRTLAMAHRWTGPDSGEPLGWVTDSRWTERNSRYRGTAVFHYPTYQPIPDEVEP